MRKAKGSDKLRKQAKAKPATKPRKQRGHKPVDIAKAKTPQDSGVKHAFMQPLQSPPAGREYLRGLIGRQANPERDYPTRYLTGRRNKDQQAGNYFIQLSTFHIGNRGF